MIQEFQKTYDFLLWLKPVAQKFAKAHKYGLGIEIENETVGLIKKIIEANQARNKKDAHIDEALVKYEIIRTLIRLSKDYKQKKATISPVDKGIDFLGYVVFENYKLLRKSTVKRFIKRTRKYMKMVKQKKMSEEKFDIAVASWTAYAKFGDSWRLRRRLENEIQKC